MKKDFKGAFTALVTPFLADGSVDWAGYQKNVSFQIEQGISGLLPTGTTGESPTLDWTDHIQLIDLAIKNSAGRCPIMAGTGSNSTDEAIYASRHAAAFGADAILLVDCYYNGPSSLELRLEYHAAVAEACPECTIIPYIIPGRTGTAMSAEDLALLHAEHPNVTAVKEATGDIERMALTRALVGPNFDILSGDDNITFPIMSDERIKAQGVISVISNVVPAAVTQMCEAALRGDLRRAQEINSALAPLYEIITITVTNERTMPDGSKRAVKDKFRNPAGVKALMNGLGMASGICRRPLGKLTPNAVEFIRRTAEKVWNENPWVLEPIEKFYGVSIGARLADDNCWNKLVY